MDWYGLALNLDLECHKNVIRCIKGMSQGHWKPGPQASGLFMSARSKLGRQAEFVACHGVL